MNRYFASIVGNFLEHYDAALFGFLAPFLAPYFFPESDPLQALIYTYALIPLGVLSRPLGALLFGWLGDRIGRKKTFSITLLGMALATAAMGFLPLSAPILWGALRLAQNFFAAGEGTGGALYLLEKENTRRSLWSSLYDASGILGILVASGATALFAAWEIPWKWLFWAGSATAASGIWIRLQRSEEREARNKDPLWRSLWKYRKEVASIASVSGFSYSNYYMLTTFLNGFLPLVSSMTLEEAIAMNTILLFADFLLLPLFGWIGDKVGKENLMITAVVLAIGATASLLSWTDGASTGTALLVRLSMTVLGIALSAPYHAWAIEKAPPNHRYLVCAVGTAIGSRLLGAPAPAIGLYLYQKTNLTEAAALPILLTAFLAAAVLLRGKRLEDIRVRVLHDDL